MNILLNCNLHNVYPGDPYPPVVSQLPGDASHNKEPIWRLFAVTDPTPASCNVLPSASGLLWVYDPNTSGWRRTLNKEETAANTSQQSPQEPDNRIILLASGASPM